MPDLAVEVMDRALLDLVIEWAAREGWNPGLRDADAFHPVDPAGFLLARQGGEPVGAISAVAYDDRFGFIGFYIVTPDHRGHRVGVELGKAAMEHLGGRNIGLDGVLNKVKAYENIGFKVAWNNHRYGGTARHAAPPDPSIRPVVPSDWPAVAACDRSCFPAAREGFLKTWLGLPGHVALCHGINGRLGGFGVMRPCRSGFKVGPLFADDPAVAEKLFLALQRHAPEGSPVFLDVPGNNPAAVELARSQGMSVVFGTARMYNRAPPDLPAGRIFGITTFELG